MKVGIGIDQLFARVRADQVLNLFKILANIRQKRTTSYRSHWNCLHFLRKSVPVGADDHALHFGHYVSAVVEL